MPVIISAQTIRAISFAKAAATTLYGLLRQKLGGPASRRRLALATA